MLALRSAVKMTLTQERYVNRPAGYERNPNGFISSQNILNLVRTTLLERKRLVS